MRATRADKADREGVRFELGTVFLHKKYGYRGVVYGEWLGVGPGS